MSIALRCALEEGIVIVTREEYLRDVANTLEEAAAYKQIAEGFAILAELPENEAHRNHLEFQRARYANTYNDCMEFLRKLEALSVHFPDKPE